MYVVSVSRGTPIEMHAMNLEIATMRGDAAGIAKYSGLLVAEAKRVSSGGAVTPREAIIGAHNPEAMDKLLNPMIGTASVQIGDLNPSLPNMSVVPNSGTRSGNIQADLKANSTESTGTGGEVAKTNDSTKVVLTDAQTKKLKAFDKSTPANAAPAKVDQIGDQALFTAVSPGRVPGSSKVYQKSVDAEGNTTSFVKTTVTPDNKQQKVTDASKNPEVVIDVNTLEPLDKDKLKR